MALQLELFDQPEPSPPEKLLPATTSSPLDGLDPARVIAWWSERFTGDPAECLDELFAETC
jgi:hypothetical protein